MKEQAYLLYLKDLNTTLMISTEERSEEIRHENRKKNKSE